MIHLQRAISFSPQATLRSWMFTWGLEHMACGTGTAHRMETRPVAADQHQTNEESYWSTDWCGHSSAGWVTWVGCVCWHASCYPWHPGNLEGRGPSIGFGLMVRALDSRSSGLGPNPDRGHCVVFLGKTLLSQHLYPPRCINWYGQI